MMTKGHHRRRMRAGLFVGLWIVLGCSASTSGVTGEGGVAHHDGSAETSAVEPSDAWSTEPDDATDGGGMDGPSGPPPPSCGVRGKFCCADMSCNPGLACVAGLCEPIPPDAGLVDAVVVSDTGVDTGTDAGTDIPVILSDVAIGTPRPIAPLSTATVTTQRPTLRWALAAGSDGAHIEICHDRACASGVEATLDVTGSSVTVPTALVPGVHFWRLASRVGSALVTGWSVTWEFEVGHRSAPVDTSWGNFGDFNGDGYADVVVRGGSMTSRAGVSAVYPGSASGLATTPSITLPSPDGTGEFGMPIATAGDVNGDGYADLLVGSSQAMGNAGQVYVYLGSASGLTSTIALTLTGPDGALGGFGWSVTSAGDVNGDGYADVVIGAYHALSETGRVYLYMGSATGLAATPSTVLTGPDGVSAIFGVAVASAGDVSGDGYADVIIGANYALSMTGRAYIYVGGATGLSTTPATVLTGLDGAMGYFGEYLAGAGDVNGDGYADVVVSAYGAMTATGRVYVYAGGAGGVTTMPMASLTGLDGPISTFGVGVGSAGDVNGDGFGDLVVGSSGAMFQTGQAYVFAGSASGLGATPAVSLEGTDGRSAYFGCAVGGVGDVNGDGYGDVMVGAYGVTSNTGKAYLFGGSGAGLVTTPAATLLDPLADGYIFGSWVAWALPTAPRLYVARRAA